MKLTYSVSENQQYQKFLLLLKVSPAMAKLLEHLGSSSGQAFTKELDALVCHHNYYMFIFI